MREVVITGIGPLLPGCDSRARLWEHLSRGESQLAFEEAPSGGGALWPVGRVRSFDARRYLPGITPRHYERYHRDQQLYLASLALALDDAGLSLSSLPPGSVGLFDGTSRGSFDAWYERIREEARQEPAAMYGTRELVLGTPGQAANLAAIALKVRGPVYTFTGTCSAGAMAAGHAWREIALGELEVALASGHESSLSAPMYHMYRNADLLTDEEEDARKSVRAYAGHSKNAFGEGAVTLVLEERRRAERRGAEILATFGGYRYLNFAEHPTAVDTTGKLPARLIAALLAASRTDSERVSFVVGHGNGVPMSDLAEIACMQRVFGPRTAEVPLVSVKAIYGHLLGASSALNIAAGALMLHRQFVVPTINLEEKRVVDGMNHQANRGAARACDLGLALSFGIGGHMAAVLLAGAGGGGR
jgi:3-oxoacyl-[acyl-carrier-protein] synthase II